MQTIKTAAIFIFVGTVMWGAYTSLTTPPETLPEDVQELVFDHEPSIAFDEQSFGAGLSDSLPELDINSGEPAVNVGMPDQRFAADPAGVDPAFAVAGPIASNPSVTAAADLTPTIPQPDSAITARLSDTPRDQIPRSYASTSQSFSLPDPNDVVTNFTGADDQLKLPAVSSDLALASGITDAAKDQTPPHGSDLSTDVVQASSGVPNLGLANAIRTADRQYADDQRKEALSTLSIFYNTPDLSGQERANLLARLDPLAREVIYSTQHLLEKPYRVGQKESLVDIAAQYEVPWQLLANINQVPDPMALLPGTELKVVTGPFRAEVNLSKSELTLFLGDLYAGRFPIAVGADPTPRPGTFTIQDKQKDHTYYNRSGAPVPAGNPGNPYGGTWMDLGGQVCIHGSPDKRKPTDQGCISLADDFAGDLYGILSQGSSVTIRR